VNSLLNANKGVVMRAPFRPLRSKAPLLACFEWTTAHNFRKKFIDYRASSPTGRGHHWNFWVSHWESPD
jgi:hypothetical protein